MKKILVYIGIIVLIVGSLITALIFNKEDNIYDSVVYIESINEETIKNGSGFVYKKKDSKFYIVTSYHVIENYKDVYIYNTAKDKVKASILNYDEYTDIAILTVEDNLNLKKINIGDSDKINNDDKVFVISARINNIIEGKIISKSKNITFETTNGSSNLRVLELNVNVDKGDSGSPLLNKKNEAIGMLFIKENDNISYAQPINFVIDIVNKLEKNELKRPNLGAVMCNSTNQEVLNEYGVFIDSVNGVVLLEINKGYSLYNEGLKKGDIITKFNNKVINNVNELREELYNKKTDDTVSLEYYRNGTYYEVNIKL